MLASLQLSFPVTRPPIPSPVSVRPSPSQGGVIGCRAIKLACAMLQVCTPPQHGSGLRMDVWIGGAVIYSCLWSTTGRGGGRQQPTHSAPSILSAQLVPLPGLGRSEERARCPDRPLSFPGQQWQAHDPIVCCWVERDGPSHR